MKKFRRLNNNTPNSFIILLFIYFIILSFKANWSIHKKVVQKEQIEIEKLTIFDDLPIYTASHEGFVVSAKELDSYHWAEEP